MATGKYAGLPDIEQGGIDVFETPDVLGDFNYEHDDDSDSELHAPAMAPQRSTSSEDIIGEHLPLENARKRFKDARVNGDADFSSHIKRRKQRPIYPTMPETRTYEYTPRGYSTDAKQPVASTSETPIQRLRRLRIETEEVEAQLEAEGQQSVPATETSNDKLLTGALLAQLRYLRNDLTRLNTKAEASEAGVQAGEISVAAAKAETAEAAAKRGVEAPAGDLDERLVRLERFIGANEAETSEATAMPQPLIATLSKLEHQLQLLSQPRHLDTVARRVKTLVGDLERLHERRRKEGDTRPLNIALASGMTVVGSREDAQPISTTTEDSELPADALQKIDSLFAMLPRIEPLLNLAPQLLTRLKTLAPLHATAAQFNGTLSSVQGEASSLKEAEAGLNQAIEGLTKAMEGNEKVVRGNLESLQTRVDQLSRRVEAL